MSAPAPSTDSGIVIGAVPYLNGRPLIRWFRDTQEGRDSGIRVVEAVPSELARMLERREVAAAMVSSFELLRRPQLCYVPGIAIAAEGPVLSVRLLARVPIREVHSVALDSSSLTSVALLKILLAEGYGLAPRYVDLAPNLDRMLTEADAALLIGDAGYREYDPRLHVLDLGAAWKALTGLPFVYALWVGERDRITRRLVRALQTAREWGCARRVAIAEEEYPILRESRERTLDYLARIMRYEVGPREREALALFGEKARQHGLLAGAPNTTPWAPEPGETT